MIKFKQGIPKDNTAIADFYQRNYPNKNGMNEYLEYRFNFLDSEPCSNPSIFAFVGERIIGQIILIRNKIKIGPTVVQFNWGMDYIVEPEFRGGPTGVGILKKATKNQNHLGFGLSPESFKVHSTLGINVVCSYGLYINLTMEGFFYSTKKFLFKLSNNKLRGFQPPDRIQNFTRVTKIQSQVCEYYDLPFIQPSRSVQFMGKRFFFKPNKYFMYISDDPKDNSYFVIRPIKFKSLDMLLLVDYRVSVKYGDSFLRIIAASKKLAQRTGFHGVITMSSVPELSKILKNEYFLRYKEGEIVSNFISTDMVKENLGILITLADSDGDFYFSKNPWSYS